MKTIFFLSVFIAGTASAQQYINPPKIGQSGDIILQNTNVYYGPMAPPDSTDVRDSLSNLGSLLADPNGVGSGAYAPRTHGKNLQDYKPCDTCPAYGPYAIWQRLFTAKRKPDGTASDIIAGSNVTNDTLHTNGHHGEVIISKNEDVDFRASGTIKLENGFHAMPGCFFHAYQEPKWDTTVFSDEFTDSTLDRSKWTVANGPNVYYQTGVECSSDSNVRDTADPDAHDGHALDIILREVPDTCRCYTNGWRPSGTCEDSINSLDTNYFIFSTAVLHSCPWPYTDAGDSVPGYQHTPYGKYEYREKIPHTKHHTNNWGCCDSYNINETWNGDMSQMHPGVGAVRFYGPFTGSFGHKVIGGSNVWVLRSSAPNWCASNYPICLNIYGFKFNVAFDTSAHDPCVYASGGPQFPSSYVNRGGLFPFTYQRSGLNQADSLQWKVSQDGSGNWRVLWCGYHDSVGHILHFSKDYQPNQIALTVNSLTHKIDTINCHWDYSLNTPTDRGLLWLNTALAGPDSNIEPFYYWVDENNYGPAPPYAFDGEDTSGGYEYHTFGMELLPNQAIFLLDSNVVFREPDRMVPPTSKFFGVVSQIRRYPVIVYPAEIDIDGGNEFDSSYMISGGDTDWTSVGYGERHYFEVHPNNPGFWDVTIGGKTYHAAHHLVDYVKIWDVPADVKIPDFPH